VSKGYGSFFFSATYGEIDMTFVYEPELEAYMKKTGKTIIAVEVMASTHSDFDYEELYIHFVSPKTADYYVKDKKFRIKETSLGKVLLPNYVLEYDETVVFGLKKILFFTGVTQKGIRF